MHVWCTHKPFHLENKAFPFDRFKNTLVVDDRQVSRFLVPSCRCQSQLTVQAAPKAQREDVGRLKHKALKYTSRRVRVCACSQASGVFDWACRVPRWVYRICQHGSCVRRCVPPAADTSDAGDVPPWLNGQGVRLLIRRLRVREKQLSSSERRTTGGRSGD